MDLPSDTKLAGCAREYICIAPHDTAGALELLGNPNSIAYGTFLALPLERLVVPPTRRTVTAIILYHIRLVSAFFTFSASS